MTASFMWALLVIAPLVGFVAIVALAVFHEHGDLGHSALPARWRWRVRLAREPVVVRRSGTALLDEYLVDDRAATYVERQQESGRLRIHVARANTAILEEYLEERLAQLAPAPKTTPAPTFMPASKAAPAPKRPQPQPAGQLKRRTFERAPRPTRLVPLTPEIAIG